MGRGDWYTIKAAFIFLQVLKYSQRAKTVFQSLGIFKKVDVCLDQDKGNVIVGI